MNVRRCRVSEGWHLYTPTHGSRFYANKTDKNGESESEFVSFLAEDDIKRILARVKHPQTSGKIKKWYHNYVKNRNMFDYFGKLLKWYNSTWYDGCPDEKHYLQMLDDAFWSRMPVGCELANSFTNREFLDAEH